MNDIEYNELALRLLNENNGELSDGVYYKFFIESLNRLLKTYDTPNEKIEYLIEELLDQDYGFQGEDREKYNNNYRDYINKKISEIRKEKIKKILEENDN